MTPSTLVVGGSAAERERAIVAAVSRAPALPTVALLEGLPDAGADAAHPPQLQTIHIAPGCPCCIGSLTLRVTLNRILRRPPARLYIGLAATPHLPRLRELLRQPPYDALLQWSDDLPL